MFRWALIAIAAIPLPATASDDFYAGKTVKIIIGTAVGGEYGAYAQLLAQHIGKFVPGKPTVIVQTMPGGSGMVALNHLAKVAAQDGTVLSLPHVNIVQDGLLNPRALFDPAKFHCLGGHLLPDRGTRLSGSRADPEPAACLVTRSASKREG